MASRFCCQAERSIQDLIRSRGLGDVYKRREWRYDRISATMSEIETSVLEPGEEEGGGRKGEEGGGGGGGRRGVCLDGGEGDRR